MTKRYELMLGITGIPIVVISDYVPRDGSVSCKTNRVNLYFEKYLRLDPRSQRYSLSHSEVDGTPCLHIYEEVNGNLIVTRIINLSAILNQAN